MSELHDAIDSLGESILRIKGERDEALRRLATAEIGAAAMRAAVQAEGHGQRPIPWGISEVGGFLSTLHQLQDRGLIRRVPNGFTVVRPTISERPDKAAAKP